MKKMLLATLVFSLIFVPAVCSEVSPEVSNELVLQIQLEGNFKDGSRKLTLLGVNEVANIGRVWSSMVRRHNEPFFAVAIQKKENISRVKCVSHENCFIEKEQLETTSFEYQRNMKYFPVQYFAEAEEFRSHEAVMYSGTLCYGDGHRFNLSFEFDSDLEADETLKMYLHEFTQNPCYSEKDLQELLFFGLLEKKDGKIIHGSKAFNMVPLTLEEYDKLQTIEKKYNDSLLGKKEASVTDVTEQTQLIFKLQSAVSNYRKGLIGISAVFAIFMLYVLHDKFHDTLYATA